MGLKRSVDDGTGALCDATEATVYLPGVGWRRENEGETPTPTNSGFPSTKIGSYEQEVCVPNHRVNSILSECHGDLALRYCLSAVPRLTAWPGSWPEFSRFR